MKSKKNLIAQFGNWIIIPEGIRWIGKKGYVMIEKESMLDKRQKGENNIYEWLIHIAKNQWLPTKDIYSLNTTFIFALEYFGYFKSEKIYNISMVATLLEQQQILNNRKPFNATKVSKNS